MTDTGTGRKRILIIEDDSALLQMMVTALQRAGYEVIQSQDGLDGGGKARTLNPELIIQDVMVPGKSVIDVLGDLKKNPLYRNVPVILITVHTEESQHADEGWREQTGAADFMAKPFPMAELVWRVARILGAGQETGKGAGAAVRMPRILVVEDDVSLRHAIILALRKKGYDVTATDRGDEAENKIRRERPDLVVLDIMLPNKSGVDVCIDLKTDPELRQIPIILMTTVTLKSEERAREMRQLTRADDFIAKPFELAELVQRIEHVLGRDT
ncbi:MAG: response regulator [Phycisphaerae bacterium]|nr:response regulator [Phycisphaerae bacterium]